MFAVGNTPHILNIKTQIVFSAPCLQHWKLLDPLSPHPAPSPPFHPPAAGAVMGGGCRLGQHIEPLARGVWGGVAPFPSLKLFNVGSTLPAFIRLSHLYSKIPSLSELVDQPPASIDFSHLPWADGLRVASPQNQYTGELGLGRAGGTSLGLPSLCDCCHPLSSIAAL